jgi:hypothetical protein
VYHVTTNKVVPSKPVYCVSYTSAGVATAQTAEHRLHLCCDFCVMLLSKIVNTKQGNDHFVRCGIKRYMEVDTRPCLF